MDTAGTTAEAGTHALYPGSFDGLTHGHLDLLRRASRMFSRVTVAVAENMSKRETLFSAQERVDMLRAETTGLPNVSVESFGGLTVEFARSIGATVLLRGLRAVSDFEFELQMAMVNENQAPELTTIFMAPSARYSFLSSTVVKEMARHGGKLGDFVPAGVERMLRERLGSTGGR